MSVNRTGTKKLEHYWTPKSAAFTRSLSSTCLSGLSRARLPSIFLRLALSQDGHTRAADGLKLMNRGDERGMITVVKVFPSRKIVSNLKMKTQGRKGREGRDGWKKKGRKGRRD